MSEEAPQYGNPAAKHNRPNPWRLFSTSETPVRLEHLPSVLHAERVTLVDAAISKATMLRSFGSILLTVEDGYIVDDNNPDYAVRVASSITRTKMKSVPCPNCELAKEFPGVPHNCGLCGNDGVVWVRDGDGQEV